MKITLSIFLFALLILNNNCYSQIRQFTQNELPTEQLYRITQDHEGFIWIISDKGIIKYDGINTRVFTTKDGLPINDVTNIRITDDNRLWFFNYKNGQGYIYKDSVYNFPHENPNSNFFYEKRIIQEKNALKIYDSNQHLTSLEGNEWKIIKDSLNKGKEGHFLGNEFVRFIYYRNDSLIARTASNELEFLWKSTKQLDFDIYPKNLLFMSYDDSILIADLEHSKNYRIDLTPYGINVNSLLRIHFVNGRFQLTGRNFLAELDSNFKLKVIPNLSNLENYDYAMIDQLDNIWYLHFQDGIYFCPSTDRTVSTYEENNTISRLALFNEGVYFISNRENLNFVKNGHSKKIAEIRKLYDLVVQDSSLLTFSYEVRSWSNTDKVKWKRELIRPAKKIYQVSGRCFISESRISREVDSAFNTIQTFSVHFQGVAEFRDTIFVGAYNGLFYLSEDKLLRHSTQFDKPITTLNTTNNRLIIGTDGFGVYQYQHEKIEKTIAENIIIERLIIQDDAVILAATNEGAYLMSFVKDSLVLNYVYTVNDGLKSNLINDVLIFEDSIYIATNRGLSVLKYGTRNNQLQSIYLEGIKWNNAIISDSTVDELHTVNNSLEINYSAIYYATTNKLRYSYQLNPISKDFIETSNGKIKITNLDVGEYKLTFKVTDQNNYALAKTILIKIRPRWYQTVFFKIVVGFLALLIIFLSFIGYKKYIIKKSNKKIERQRQLANFKLEALRSQMNPHFVFNSLNAIQYYISENQNELSEEYLVKFSKLIRQFFDLSDVSKIPLEQELNLLRNYLDLEKMRFSQKLNYGIKVDAQLSEKNVLIPTMILQPIVENAINHGIFHKDGPGIVSIIFKSINADTYEVSIKDDGIGMVQSKAMKKRQLPLHDSKSTLIFKERIDLLNSNKEWFITYAISTAYPDIRFPGTLITLTIQKL